MKDKHRKNEQAFWFKALAGLAAVIIAITANGETHVGSVTNTNSPAGCVLLRVV